MGGGGCRVVRNVTAHPKRQAGGTAAPQGRSLSVLDLADMWATDKGTCAHIQRPASVPLRVKRRAHTRAARTYGCASTHRTPPGMQKVITGAQCMSASPARDHIVT